MKKNLSILITLALMLIASQAMAFEPPNGALYGITKDGTYFIAKSLVDEAGGSAPKLMSARLNWARQEMKLSGNFYIYETGKKIEQPTVIEFCFDIGGNRYIPHTLVGAKGIIENDIAPNGVGGFNFKVKPSK